MSFLLRKKKSFSLFILITIEDRSQYTVSQSHKRQKVIAWENKSKLPNYLVISMNQSLSFNFNISSWDFEPQGKIRIFSFFSTTA